MNKHDTYNTKVEQVINRPTNNHTFKDSKNQQDVQGEVELHKWQL